MSPVSGATYYERRLSSPEANHVYEHVADLDAFFAEIARALAPGAVRGKLLEVASPQWFFFVRHAEEVE